MQLVYDAVLTRHVRTRGVSGQRTLEGALDELLTGTGLAYEINPGSRSAVIVLAQANTGTRSDARGAQALPTIDIDAARPARQAARRADPSPADGRPALSSSRFPNEPKTPTQGYVVQNAVTGLKLDVPVKETPASIAVVPKQVMQDQNAMRLQDALENVSGVQSNNNDVEGYNFYLRGFPARQQFRNALSYGNSQPGVVDTANIERIEVLKGPASFLFGRTEPGGLINIVTKQPLALSRYLVEQQIGSYDYFRTQWDISTPISSVDGLAARVSAAPIRTAAPSANFRAASASWSRRSSATGRATGPNLRSTRNFSPIKPKAISASRRLALMVRSPFRSRIIFRSRSQMIRATDMTATMSPTISGRTFPRIGKSPIDFCSPSLPSISRISREPRFNRII